MDRSSGKTSILVPVVVLLIVLGMGGVFLHSLFAERYAQSADDAIATGKTQLFAHTVSGALAAYHTFQAAAAESDYSAANDSQKIRMRVYLAFTRMVDTLLREDGGSVDTLADFLAQYGVSRDGDAFDTLQFNPPPLNDDGKLILPAFAPASADAVKAFFAGPFLAAVNASIADMDAAIALCPTDGTEGVDREIISKTLIAPDDSTQRDLEIDAGDYWLFRSLLKFMKSYALMCAGNNADIDIREIVALVNLGAGPEMIKTMLDRYPDFLKISDPDKLKEARLTLIDAITDYETASGKIRGDASTQTGAEELISLELPDRQREAFLREQMALVKDSLLNNKAVALGGSTEQWTFTASDLSSAQDIGISISFSDSFSESGSYYSNVYNAKFGWGAQMEYAIITGNDVMLRFNLYYPYYGWLEFRGTFNEDKTQITGGTYNGWNGSLGAYSGTFSATRNYLSASTDNINLYHLFGNGTTNSPQALRDLLPQVNEYGFAVPGTMGHGLSNDPKLGGILPDFSQNRWLMDLENVFMPTGPLTSPVVADGAITVDGATGDWDGISPILADLTGEKGPWMATNGDLKQLYLAKDSQYLYVRMDMNGNIASSSGQSFMYGLRFRQSPGDGPDKAGDTKVFARKRDGVWEVKAQSIQTSGVYGSLGDLGPYGGFAASSGSTVEWRVPLSGTSAGRFLAVDIDSWYYYGALDYGWSPYDSNLTCLQVQPTATVSGTLSVPGYDGVGAVRIGVFEYVSGFSTDPLKSLGGITIYPQGSALPANYTIDGLPVGRKAFVSVFWDRDGNGVVTPGDYTNFYQPFTTASGVNTQNLALAASDDHPVYSPPAFKHARVFKRKTSTGAWQVDFDAVITGPSPEDVTITAKGPGGEFTLTPSAFVRGTGLDYKAMVSWLLDGDYTFTAVDSRGRQAETTYHFQNRYDLPSPVIPDAARYAYAGTTTPTLSWTPPATGGPYSYQVVIIDWRGSAVWYISEPSAAASATVPAGVLLPDTGYVWYVRLLDDAGHPMNCMESNYGYLYTGAYAETPSSQWVSIGSRPPSGASLLYSFWVDAKVPGLAPWEVGAIRLKDAAGNTVLQKTSSLFFVHFMDSFFEAFVTQTNRPAPGPYTIEMDYLRSGQIKTLTVENIPFTYADVLAVDLTSLAPGANYYFKTTQPTFSWSPISDPNAHYRVKISEPMNRIPIWKSDWSKNTSATVPAGILEPGGTYYWTVLTTASIDPMFTFSYVNAQDSPSSMTAYRFTIDAGYQNASPPAFTDNGYGIVIYNTASGANYDIGVNIVDLDGIASGGSSHTVTMKTPSGKEYPLYYSYSTSPTAAYYTGFVNLNGGSPESGDFTFTVTDPEGNTGTMVDKVVVNILPLPDAATFSLAADSVLADTTPTVTWAAVAGAQEYRLRIYSANGSTIIWTGTVGDPSCTVPPGVLAPGADYRYRVYARDARWPNDIDNVSVTPATPAAGVPFTTGALTDGPFIAPGNGVMTYTSMGGVHSTRLNFYIIVHDARGVPGNIRSVRAIFPSGHQEPLYYDIGNSDNAATKGVYTNAPDVPPEPGRYTFVVEDIEGRTFTVSEELTVNPIDYPALTSLSPAMNAVIGGTAVNFDWEDVPGASWYKLRIYDAKFNQVFWTSMTQSAYALPAGILKADSLYRYDIRAYREAPGEEADNFSSSKWGNSDMPTFLTGSVLVGSFPPVFDLKNVGVYRDHMTAPGTGDSLYQLNFYVGVRDPDGVPGNIASVRVTYPDGSTTRDLRLDSVVSETEANYYAVDLAPGTITEGKYTFTVMDFDGNTATAEDVLTIADLPCPVNLSPAAGAVVIGTTPTITWDTVTGANGGYIVRINDGWDRQIYSSSRFTTNFFTVPAGILQLNATYSYTVYAYKEPSGEDLDNRSLSDYRSVAEMTHFTTSSTHQRGDVDGNGAVELADLVVSLQTAIGMRPDVFRDADVNRDGKIGIPEAIYILQSLSGRRY